MKKSIILAILFAVTFFAFSENQHDEIFRKAVTTYEQKDFSNSLQLFLGLENNGIVNADLFYNIGNCYFRLNKLGKAILYYKKALKVNSSHRAAERNLKYALTFTKDKQTIEKEDSISLFFHKLFNFFSLNLLAIILLILFLLIIFIINLIILRYRETEKTVPVFFLFVFISLFVLFAILGYLKWKHFHGENEAVLLSQSAIGYSGPNEDFTRVFTIHEGMIFTIEKTENGWSLIKLPNGLGGWIKNDNFERVKI
ncbi:MAG: hypothetical protein DRZ79_02330 [Candidatus Cloacimonadota bacterium]|nr:MAG: hypothetical protein DRZ79_02330 [Candidatus Cloacimonadota bacterium]